MTTDSSAQPGAVVAAPSPAGPSLAAVSWWERVPTLLRHIVIAAIAVVLLDRLTVAVSPYRATQLAQIAYYACAAAGLSVLTGLSGQISLGQGALMTVGAYAYALLAANAGLPWLACLVLAAVVAGVSGLLIGAAAARLRGPYLAGATLALAVGLPRLAEWGKLSSLKGATGINVDQPNPPGWLGSNFAIERWQADFCIVVAAIVFVVLANLIRSRVGRAWRAVRDDEVSALLAGLSVPRLQILAFIVASICAGVAGALLVFVNGSIASGTIDVTVSLNLLAVVVLGGLGSLAGALYGSVLIVLLPDWITDLANSLSLPGQVKDNLPLAIYGVVLIVVMLVFPLGVQGLLRRGWAGARAGVLGKVRAGSSSRSRVQHNVGDHSGQDEPSG